MSRTISRKSGTARTASRRFNTKVSLQLAQQVDAITLGDQPAIDDGYVPAQGFRFFEIVRGQMMWCRAH
jgi:hypothetical protein